MSSSTGHCEVFLETAQGRFCISDDAARLQPVEIHAYLTGSYWSPGVDLATVQAAIEGSSCFGVYDSANRQVGFARLVTDRATFAYLADVYVLDAWRGLGLGKALVAQVLRQPFVARLRRVLLATRDAHELYRQNGFSEIAAPGTLMEILRPDVYR